MTLDNTMNTSETSTTENTEDEVVFLVEEDDQDFLSSFLTPKEDKA